MPLLSVAEMDAHLAPGSGRWQGQCRVLRHFGSRPTKHRCLRPSRRTGGRDSACCIRHSLLTTQQNYQRAAAAFETLNPLTSPPSNHVTAAHLIANFKHRRGAATCMASSRANTQTSAQQFTDALM